jgi:hypothetical protein
MASDRATGVVAAVQRDHREIEEMLKTVEEASGAARRAAFDRLAEKMKVHEAAEEEVVHPLAMAEGNGDTVDELVDEEMTAARALTRLEGMDFDSDEFERAFAELKHDVLAHAEQEERDEHPQLLEDTPDDELERREEMFERAERDAAGR